MDRVFYWCSGQDDNIGDVVLRRNLLNRVRELGDMHVYIGSASDSFVEALRLSANTATYRSKTGWLKAVARHSRRAMIVFDPGEYRLDGQARKAHLALIPLQVLVKARGGASIKSGIAVNPDWIPVPLSVRLFDLSNQLSDVVTWRDLETPRGFAGGLLSCDWAFDSYDAASWAPRRRDCLAISCRGDRPVWHSNIIEGTKRLCEERQLRPVVYVQVRRDNDVARELSNKLGCELVNWGTSVSHADQEVAVRKLLRSGEGIVSDRLHALIMGVNEGCVPIGLSQFDDFKLRTHLAAAGLGRHSTLITDAEASDVAERIGAMLDRRSDVAERARDAKAASEKIADRIKAVCS